MLTACDQERVDHPLAGYSGTAGAIQFGVEEAEIEHRIMRNELGVAEKGDELFHFVGEQRLILEEFAGQGVNLKCGFRHVAFGIEVTMESLAGRETIDEFDAADLDQAIALGRIEPCCLGIENDLAH